MLNDRHTGIAGAQAQMPLLVALLAQALEHLEAAAPDLMQSLAPLSVAKDKIAKITAGAQKLDAGASQARMTEGSSRLADGNAGIAEGRGTLCSGAAAVSPSTMVGQSDAAMALGAVGVLRPARSLGC